MIGVDVQYDPRQLASLEQRLAGIKNGLPKAMSRALNKTATYGRTLFAKRMSEVLGLKQSEIKRNTKILRASWKKWLARIMIFGKAKPLIKYRARQTMKGVTARIGDEKRRLYPHAFIATMPTGRMGVFLRATINGKMVPRLPIRELFGPSVVTVFQDNDKLVREFDIDLSDRLEMEVDRQVGVLMEGGR